jgi:hypothetical protein
MLSCSARLTVSCVASGSGTFVAEDLFSGTGPRVVLGLGPVAFHWPNDFSIAAFAYSGVTSPITTMVVRSGRTVSA